MKKSRFTESQIVAILKELDAGTSATELGRKHGIHANTIRLWRDRYAGLESSDDNRESWERRVFGRLRREAVVTPMEFERRRDARASQEAVENPVKSVYALFGRTLLLCPTFSNHASS